MESIDKSFKPQHQDLQKSIELFKKENLGFVQILLIKIYLT
ncbi:unnamed protein product [Paramecium sonneborni]|uniref:Uncharacterized protein n=1 Tax=Paramecium sonneborni TaxID=65129 RepID=A0A8S1NYN5_9CILI|nr:unnamed protein product [Paramecium sonneborni]